MITGVGVHSMDGSDGESRISNSEDGFVKIAPLPAPFFARTCSVYSSGTGRRPEIHESRQFFSGIFQHPPYLARYHPESTPVD